MKSQFPEKAYETLFNHELINKGYILYVPSQVKEEHSGYDVLINNLKTRRFKALALQYKIVDEYSRIPYPFSKPCFRFDLHKSSKGYKQHNTMVKRNISPHSVIKACYCVPMFVDYPSLYNYSQSDTLMRHSRLLCPISKINDTKYHQVKFDSTKALQYSTEPSQIVAKTFESLFETEKFLSYEQLLVQFEAPIDTEDNLDRFLMENEMYLLIKPE